MLYITDKESVRQEVMRIVDTTTVYVVEIKEISSYTAKQRGALHVWCSRCAKALNDADMLRERPNILGDGTVTIPWTMITFKEDVYKYVLDITTGKKSTEGQSSVDPSVIVDAIRKAYWERKGIDLPTFPTK